MRLISIMNNFNSVIIKDVILYFSYETLIGISRGSTTLVAKNEWSRTTGKHINYIKKLHNSYFEVEHEEVLEFANSLF